MMSKSGEYQKRDFKSARDWHIYHVYNDPEFLADLKAHNDKPRMESYETIAAKYSVKPIDVFFFQLRDILYLEKNIERKYEISPNYLKNEVTFKVDPRITKSEFMEMWDEFSILRDRFIGKPKTKRKPPENHDLVYAIFKAHKQHSFPEIYNMAVSRKLPYYAGVIPDYMDEDKFEEFYHKYKPADT